jgi:predicted nucleic acid-binding protein
LILVDSNVWVYYLDAALSEHTRVSDRMDGILPGEEVLIPAVVQLEVIHHLVLRLGKAATEAVHAFLAFPGEVEPLTGRHAAEAARLLLAHRASGVGSRDAALLLLAQRTGATLVTSDKPLLKLAKKLDVPTINPTA